MERLIVHRYQFTIQRSMRVFSILFFIFLVKISSAQVVFSVEVLSDSMQIGDVNVYRLKVAHPENVTIRSIDLKPIQTDPLTTTRFYQDTSFTNDPQKMAQLDEYFQKQGFSREIMEIQKYGNWNAPDESMMLTGSEANWTTQKNGNQVLKENDIQFTFWEEGIHKILPPNIEYEQNGALRTINAKDIEIQVGSPLALESTPIDSMTVEPIKSVREEPIDFVQDILIPASLFILGFLFIGGIVYFLVKRANRPKVALPKPKEFVPANVIAINQLEELKGKQLWQKGDIKGYQSELTHIIRAYLENRYKINALEHTTNQIGQDLKKLNLTESLRNEVQNILQVADLVKFAKAEPADNIHEQFMTKAYEFVETTKKAEAEIIAEKEAIDNEYNEKVSILTAKPKYPNPWLRFFANAIDGFIFYVSFSIGIGLVLYAYLSAFVDTDMNEWILINALPVSGIILILFLVYAAFYFPYLESSMGSTAGKKLLGLRVQNIDGSNISFGKSIVRFIAKNVMFLFLGMPFLSVFFTKKKQTPYDIFFEHELVRETPKPYFQKEAKRKKQNSKSPNTANNE